MHAGIAGDAGHVAERLPHRLAERDADILGGVVIVDMEVALRLHGEIDARMAGQQVQHMIEEADPGGDIGRAGAVKIHRNLDIGFLGLALDGGLAHETGSPPARIFENALF